MADEKEQPKTLVRCEDDSQYAMLLDSDKFAQLQRAANLFASSATVPAHYRGKPADCAVAIMCAMQLGQNPFMFMNKTYVVGGKIAMEGQLIIALINTRGPFTGPVNWKIEGKGKDMSCTAYATHKVTGTLCEATVTMKMAEAEGWTKNSKWTSMPEQMIRYRSATFLARLFCPEVLLGMETDGEPEDIRTTVVKTEIGGLEKRLRKHVESETAEPEIPTRNPEPEPEQIQKSDDRNTTPMQKEFRYYCNDCSAEFDVAQGKKSNMCDKCLSENIIDREKP